MMSTWRIGTSVLLLICLYLIEGGYGQGDAKYLIGAGIADITGPAADVPLMGYAKPDQTAGGIHLRLYSRAFITCQLDDTDCVVFVNMDIGMGCTAINLKVFERLREKWGDRYNEQNVAISATHTHSGPGGYLQFFLFTVTTAGFQQDSFDIIVDGVVKSIERAHDKLTRGHIFLNTGELLDASINRSPTAYSNNPRDERDRYEYDTDTVMTVAKFVEETTNKDIGVISWFPVHPVSMNNSNQMISSDNKGYASYMYEQDMNNGQPMGQGDFVAIFANANHGDTSPNTNGPKCIDTGLACRRATSTCNDRSQLCIAFGPGKDMFDSTRIIGEKQYVKAKDLYDSATIELDGPTGGIHQFVDMTNYPVYINDTYTAHTCKPAMGYSFAAGTIDGPGEFTFTQGDTEGDDFWDAIRDLIKEPSQEMLNCQAPKPVLLPIGEMMTPWNWAPAIVKTQILRIGSLVINMVPGEFTTMSGRRLKESVNAAFTDNGVADAHTVMTGLSNTYTDYVVTREEYQIQRYEGASTVYGQHTLQAYVQQYTMLATHLAQDLPVDSGPAPEDILDEQISYLAPPTPDATPGSAAFGDAYIDTDARYRQGGVASATFWAGNLRHDSKAMVDSTFLSVEMENSTGVWDVMYNDADWNTRFMWEKKVVTEESTQSLATVRFDIPTDAPLGTYRLRHQGYYKNDAGSLMPYEGMSSNFEVLDQNYVRPSFASA